MTILLAYGLSAISLYDVHFSALEADHAICLCKKCIVSTQTDVDTGNILRSALPYNNCPGLGWLATEKFYTTVFRITISTVPG